MLFRSRGLGRGRRGAGEDAIVDIHAERSTRVHWFGYGVRLPSPQNNKGCGVSSGMAWSVVAVVGGGEAFATAQPAMGGKSTRHDRC